MMGFTGVRWCGAPRYNASAVSSYEGAALGGSDGADVASEVKDGTVFGEEDGLEDGVAGESVK